MAERTELVGGPLDGHTIPPQSGRYAWVSGKLLVTRERVGAVLVPVRTFQGKGASTRPTSGAALYDTSGVYAGHRTTYCNACGGYHGKVEGGSERPPCALGGGP